MACLFVQETSPGSGLNAAICAATRAVATMVGDAETLVIVADLPTVNADALDRTVQVCRRADGPMFVADRAGTGTTVVYRPRGDIRDTRFGDASAKRHRRAGYLPVLAAAPALRADLDRPDDLEAVGTPPWVRRLARR